MNGQLNISGRMLLQGGGAVIVGQFRGQEVDVARAGEILGASNTCNPHKQVDRRACSSGREREGRRRNLCQ